ncbi:MAG: hypothetical protein HC800_20500 [Phormidesmis sp. RL_2_1]|nr:hypothetical protein [Phormidesmis sp. RL_2_1]
MTAQPPLTGSGEGFLLALQGGDEQGSASGVYNGIKIMSRHYIEHNDTHGITVGWDRPLGTFFAQVELLGAADDQALLLDIGSPFDCLYTQIDRFHEAFVQHLHNLGIDDFELSQAQLLKLLDDQNGIGN